MEAKRELKFGETPWDKLTKEELLREVQRLWATLTAVGSILAIDYEASVPFWGEKGRGGRAMEMLRQTTEPISEMYDKENLYQSFFRYADDLLFDNSNIKLGFGWGVCPVCRVMYGRRADGVESIGTYCRTPFCDGVLQPLTWDDMKSDD